MTEFWLPVVGWEDRYEVSDLGQVRSVERRTNTARGTRRVRERILRPKIDRAGYPHVHLHAPSGGVSYKVATLVARAFLGERPPGYDVCHDDGVPENSALTNLRYDTKSENQRDWVRHGTHHMHNRPKCPRNHVLEAPNLVRSRLPYRTCLACNRARANIQKAARRGEVIDLQERSDWHYARILRARPKSGVQTLAR